MMLKVVFLIYDTHLRFKKNIDFLSVLGQLLILNSAIFAEILSKKFSPHIPDEFQIAINHYFIYVL